MGRVRVVVTRIEPDGTMHRRMVDTVLQSDPHNWDDLAARALAIQPPYRPIPGTAVYHLCVDRSIIQVGEYDLEGPLRDLVIMVLAVGSKMLPAPNGRPRASLAVHAVPAGSPRVSMIRNKCGMTFAASASRSHLRPGQRHKFARSGRWPSEPCACPLRARAALSVQRCPSIRYANQFLMPAADDQANCAGTTLRGRCRDGM